ncbi:hypothetical protein GCM10022420_022550 [Streptomyces iranensis]
MMLRKALVTLGCVAAIGMAGAGTASASAQHTQSVAGTQSTVGTQSAVGTQSVIGNFKTRDECKRVGTFLAALGSPRTHGWSCMLNQQGTYTLRVF